MTVLNTLKLFFFKLTLADWRKFFLNSFVLELLSHAVWLVWSAVLNIYLVPISLKSAVKLLRHI